MLRSSHLLAAAIVGASFAMPLAAQDQAEAPAPTSETVVATVNGVDITLGHMIAARGTLPEEYNQVPADEIYDGVLQQLIQQEALSQSLVGEPPSRIEIQLENERRSLRAQQEIGNILQTAVTEEALQALYDEQFGHLAPEEEYNASHILVATEQEALAVKEALDGGADFAATARETSTGPSGPNGGELGWFGPGMMVAEFETATVALGLGEVSGPVETQFGWHVIKLNDKREANIPTFEEMRQNLVNELRNRVARRAIDEAADTAEVNVPDDLVLDPAVLTQLDLLD